MFLLIARSKNFVLLTVMAIALAACGEGSENSNTASTIAKGVKNAALTCAAGGACVVGDTGPGGGKVFYVAPTSFTSKGSACGSTCKYLETAPVGWIKAATPAGQSNCGTAGTRTTDPQCAWSFNAIRPIGTSSASFSIGGGYANTSAMIAQSNVGSRAATVARAFQGGGKSDWFLPSKDELNQMYLQRSAIGGFAAGGYWSSSEYAPSLAWGHNFSSGYQFNANKAFTYYVRPVRAFSGSWSAPLATSTSSATTIVAAATTTVAATTLACAVGGACVVGDTGPGGGKVFYIAPTSFTSTGSVCGSACKYLEAAPVGWITAATPAGQTNCGTPGTRTADPQCVWSGNAISRIGTTSNAIGAGYANTSAMIAQSNVAGGAATVARAFQGGGKSDWFLPSKDELNQMYLQRSAIGGFASDFYRSSSEDDANGAWYQFFNGGGQLKDGKTGTGYVRPVRAF